MLSNGELNAPKSFKGYAEVKNFMRLRFYFYSMKGDTVIPLFYLILQRFADQGIFIPVTERN